jgi:hypothetical protein
VVLIFSSLFSLGFVVLAGVFVGRDRDREERLREREEVGQVIRIDPGNIRLFIDASRSWKSFEEILRRGGSPIEFFVEIMSRALITALTTPGEVIPVISRNSYVSALRSRMVIAIEVLRNDVEAALNSCVALAEKYARKELTVEEEKEELPKCMGLINNLPLVGLLALAVAEAIHSVAQVNVPPELQSSYLQALAGYHTL